MPDDLRHDVELLEACRGGDAEAFAAFFRRHRALVLAYLARRTRAVETAADLMAETFAAALERVLDLERELPREPVAWLMTVARNKLIDSNRRGRVEQAARDRLAFAPVVLVDGGLERLEELIDATDVAGTLAAALPADQLEALRSRVLEERDYGEIASEMRSSEALVRKRVSRALTTLRTAMEALR